MTFEIIWICYDRARNIFFMPYTIWKTKTRWTKCNSPHKMKLSFFTGRIGRPEGRNIFKFQPTHDEFCHKRTLCDYWDFLYVVGNHLGPMHNTINPLELVDRESVEICDQTQKWIFFVIDFFSPEWNGRQSFPNKISPNYKIFYRKLHVPWMKCHMTFGINAVCIFRYRLQERKFSFSEICRQNRHFENGYHKITISLENRAVIANITVQLVRKRN